MLAVGDSTWLEIIFSTKTYKSKVTKRPRISTNEGQPDKHVTIAATVTPRPDSTYPIRISPYKLDLSQFSEKLIDEAEFTITNVSDQELELALAADLPEYAEIELPESIGPGDSETARVTLKEEAHDESFEKSFTIEVSDEIKSRFTIPIKRTVRSQASPRTVTFPKGK